MKGFLTSKKSISSYIPFIKKTNHPPNTTAQPRASWADNTSCVAARAVPEADNTLSRAALLLESAAEEPRRVGRLAEPAGGPRRLRAEPQRRQEGRAAGGAERQ